MNETGRIIITIIVGLLFMALLRFFLLEKWRMRRQKKAMRRGNRLEKEAARFLRSKGFNVLKSQYEIEYTIWEDGADKFIRITPDYLVEKNGREYIVEVKSGKQAPGIGYAPTRRQLLEYVVASDVDGVFLLDMEQQVLKKVEFELTKSSRKSLFGWVVIAVLFPSAALFLNDMWWRYGLLSSGFLTVLIIRQLLKRKQ